MTLQPTYDRLNRKNEKRWLDFLTLVKKGDAAGVQREISAHEFGSHMLGVALYNAALNGHESVVRVLLPLLPPPHFDPSTQSHHDEALEQAAANGYENVVRLLLPLSYLSHPDSNALQWAAEEGHDHCVMLLVEHCNLEKTWQRLEERESWDGLDRLSPYVSEDLCQTMLTKAPLGAMPRTQGRILAQSLSLTLGEALTPAPTALKPRL